MKNILLGIIAINLTIISINMALKSVESAQAVDPITKVVICDRSGSFCADVEYNELQVNID